MIFRTWLVALSGDAVFNPLVEGSNPSRPTKISALSRFVGGSSSWQKHVRPRPLTRLARERQCTAVRLDNLLRQGEPEPDPAGAARAAAFGAEKGREHSLQIGGV